MPQKKLSFNMLVNEIKDWVNNNRKYKIIALIIAIAAWVWVSLIHNVTVKMDVEFKVAAIRSDSGLVYLGDNIPKYITVTLYGPSDVVKSLRPNQVQAILDVDKPIKGDMQFDLTSRKNLIPVSNEK